RRHQGHPHGSRLRARWQEIQPRRRALGAKRSRWGRNYCRAYQWQSDSRHYFHERDSSQRHARSVRTRHGYLDGSFRAVRHALSTALGIKLREDPWEMNKIGARTNHPPSMLYDIRHRQPTEVVYLGGAIAREAARLGVPAPLHTAMYRLIKGKEASWNFAAENQAEHA